MSYYQTIQNLYQRERYFTLASGRYKYIGQLKFNKISCPKSFELEVEREFRDFVRQEIAIANFGKFHIKFQVDHRGNSNDAIAFVTCEINSDHLAIIERLDEVRFRHKYMAVRVNGFTNEALNRGSIQFGKPAIVSTECSIPTTSNPESEGNNVTNAKTAQRGTLGGSPQLLSAPAG